MRRFRWMLSVLLLGIVLWGCGETRNSGESGEKADGEASAAGTGIEILKDGSIVETMTEEFAKAYYDEKNLQDMLLAGVEEFNKGQEGGKISVDKFENEDGRLTVSIKYPSADAYTEYNTDSYNNKRLFCGTVAEADAAGCRLDISLTDVKGEKAIGKEEILKMGSSRILIAEFPSRVKVKGKILYVGENVEVLGRNYADMRSGSNGEALGRYYIIYK